MKNVQWIQQEPIVHRGLWDQDVPENSLKAFKSAVDANYPIELDVQMTADKQFVVFHDWTMQRMCGENKCVAKSVMKEIATCTLKSSQEHIPSLCDVLHMINGRVSIVIEMKNKEHERKIFVKELQRVLGTYKGIYALSSFDPFLVKEAKRLFPQILCGQNFSDYKNHGTFFGSVRKIVMYILWFVSWHDPDFFVCRASMLPHCWIVKRASKKNTPLLTWALGSTEDHQKLSHVVDNEIFDHVSYMKK